MSRIVIEIPDDVHTRLREQVAADGHTLAWLVRSWVDAYLNREPAVRAVDTPLRDRIPKERATDVVHRVDLSKGAQAKGGSRK